MLAKDVGLFERQTDPPLDLTLEDDDGIPPSRIPEEHGRLLNAMAPMERKSVRRALEKNLQRMRISRKRQKPILV